MDAVICLDFIKNDNFLCIDEKIKKKKLFFQHNLAIDSSFNEFDIIIVEEFANKFENYGDDCKILKKVA